MSPSIAPTPHNRHPDTRGEHLHYFSQKVIVIKLGGSIFASSGTILEDVVTLWKRGIAPVVVHGGGNRVSDWLRRLGISTKLVDGLRVTDAQTLQVVVAVLGGLVNKELVATIETSGGKAIGLSGVDGGLIQARIKDPEMGYVGEIVKVDPSLLRDVLDLGYISVIAPVSLGVPTGDGSGRELLNINGDTAAGEIAATLDAGKLIFLTDVVGICDESGRLIAHLSPAEARLLLSSGVASGGMIPKIKASLRALSTVPVTRIIDGRTPHALLDEMEGKVRGTTIDGGEQ